MESIISEVTRKHLKQQVPDFRPGDTVRVAVRIIEGDKERIQNFEGVCIGRSGSGMDETFTVRRVSYGVGMERIFPLHSPRVESIKVMRQGHVRRAKLYYLRDLTGKKARLAETRRKRLARNSMLDVALAAGSPEPAVEEAPAATTQAEAPEAPAEAASESAEPSAE